VGRAAWRPFGPLRWAAATAATTFRFTGSHKGRPAIKGGPGGPPGRYFVSLSFPDPGPRCPDPCLYTQPRSFMAVATRSMATMYAALRMYTFFFSDMSSTAWNATVILSSRRLTTSSFDQ
jgi:hypothetical protein